MENWVHSFIFSAWDNVVGPKVLKVWPTSGFNSNKVTSGMHTVVDEVGIEIQEDKCLYFSDELNSSSKRFDSVFPKVDDYLIAKYISVHTLTGHLAKSRHTHYDGMNEIFLSVPALGFASQTITFNCICFSKNDDEIRNLCIEEPHMASLSAVFDHDKYNEAFWHLQPLIIHLLSRTVERLKVGLSQDLNYHDDPDITKCLGEIQEIITQTRLLKVNLTQISSPISVKKIMKKSSFAWDIVITSMLTTMGSCCIVGKNEEQINRIIDVLAFFLPERFQVSCSRYAASTFSSGLYIQGLVENPNGLRNINSTDIMLNEFPLTLVDLSQKGKVKFSGNAHEHYRNRQRHSREQEFNIIQGRQPNLVSTTESVFRPFGESSRYVRWCLEQLATHNSEHWTRIISAFHQALALQAHDVIKAFQSRPSLNSDALKLIRQQLNKSMKIAESDFWLLVSTAERLKPGFSHIFVNYRI